MFGHGYNCSIYLCTVHWNNYNAQYDAGIFVHGLQYVHITLCLFQSPVLSMILAMWVMIILG